MRYSVEDATEMLQEELADNHYVVNDLLGNAGFERKVKSFIKAYIGERKKMEECSKSLKEILEEAGVSKSGVIEVFGLVTKLYKDEPLLYR